MAAAVLNGTFASPLADAAYPAAVAGALDGSVVGKVYSSLSALNVSVMVLLGLVVYDQCTFPPFPNSSHTYDGWWKHEDDGEEADNRESEEIDSELGD